MFPDTGVDRLEHPFQDVRKLRGEGVDDTAGSRPVGVAGVGEDSTPGGPEAGGKPHALFKERGVVVEEETDEGLLGAGER